MGTYLFAYRGGTTPTSDAERETVMAAWGTWLGSLGDAIVDIGKPCGASSTVAADGTVSEGAPSGLAGYTVLSADSLHDASVSAKGCPILAAGGSVDVYETFDVM
jgi:hypothetical protein